MSGINSLLQALKSEIREHSVYPIKCKVISVESSTCTVELLDYDLKVSEVLITSTEENLLGIYKKPKAGVYGIVLPLNNELETLFLVHCDEYEEISFLTEKGKLTLKQKINIENDGVNLKSIISDFIDEVAKIVVVQGVPPNVSQLTSIKNNLNKLFE